MEQLKKQYVAPTLKEHGMVRTLTQGGSGSRKGKGKGQGQGQGKGLAKGKGK